MPSWFLENCHFYYYMNLISWFIVLRIMYTQRFIETEPVVSKHDHVESYPEVMKVSLYLYREQWLQISLQAKWKKKLVNLQQRCSLWGKSTKKIAGAMSTGGNLHLFPNKISYRGLLYRRHLEIVLQLVGLFLTLLRPSNKIQAKLGAGLRV